MSLWMFCAAGSAGAVPFHAAYGRIDQFGGLTSVAPTTHTPGSIATGYFNEGFIQGMLLKVQPTGNLAWVKAYGDPFLSAARETAAGAFTWIGAGNVGTPPRIEPVVAGVDPMGAVLWAREIHLPRPDGTPGDQVYGRFLEIDSKGGGYWVGGEFWRTAFVDSEPWLGRLDSAGNLLWAQVLSFPESARFHSLFPALDGGVIGVGQIWLRSVSGSPLAWMLAVKLRADGSFEWGFRYRVHNAAYDRSWQWLADLDRDPSYTRPEAAVVGTVTDFCKSVPSGPCDPVRSAAFVATLDETTGHLSKSYGLFSATKPSTVGETIIMDLRSEVYAVGGEIVSDERGSREGFLARTQEAGSLVGAMSFGDGAGPFNAFLGSLALDRHPTPDGSGYLFLLNESHSSSAASRRDLVRTDLAGSSGACECKTEIKTFQAWLDKIPVQPVVRSGWPETVELVATAVHLPEEPCQTQVCRPTLAPRAEEGNKAPAPEAATIFPGVPDTPEGPRWSMPLRALPPQKVP